MTQKRIAPHHLALLLAATAVVCSPAMASGQWKWRDANGSIQYSDRAPPQGTPESSILSRPRGNVLRIASTPAPSASEVVSSAAPTVKAEVDELDAKRKKAEAEKLAQQKAEEQKQAQQRAQNCARAQDYQRTLNDGIRIVRTNAKGEREFLNDAQRAQELRIAQESIQANCR